MPRLHARSVIPIVLFLVVLWCMSVAWRSPNSSTSLPFDLGLGSFANPRRKHPIPQLIAAGRTAFDRLNKDGVNDTAGAAIEYRRKRGRHPPPDFDNWVAYAQSQNSSLNEVFYDQIYEDLDPFWSMDPKAMRDFATGFVNSISIREGQARFRIDPAFLPGYFHSDWVELWIGAMDKIPYDLPDMDLALNEMDESRIIVPWEDMAEIMRESRRTRRKWPWKDSKPARNHYSVYPNITHIPPLRYDKPWNDHETTWERVRKACPPKSKVKSKDVDMSDYPVFSPPHERFVSNLTRSQNVCEHPDLYTMHSAFVRPHAPATTEKLVPLFSACKLVGVNNDILLPAAQYMNQAERFAGGNESSRHLPWNQKRHAAFWRGSVSGGQMNEVSWRYFQRPRLASMLNGSQVAAQEASMTEPRNRAVVFDRAAAVQDGAPFSFPWPDKTLAALSSVPSRFAAWVWSISEAGFVNTRMCQWGSTCEWLWPFFNEVPNVGMREMFKYKFLPDVDGYAYSGRYHSFLDSTSLPIKATVYSEWHNSRLVPWYHFVPMQNTFSDWWGLMEYFAGFDAAKFGADQSLHREPHDADAEAIALQGKDWAGKHLRESDMIVYIYRLLLEYARLCDDSRLEMGWTEDLGHNV